MPEWEDATDVSNGGLTDYIVWDSSELRRRGASGCGIAIHDQLTWGEEAILWESIKFSDISPRLCALHCSIVTGDKESTRPKGSGAFMLISTHWQPQTPTHSPADRAELRAAVAKLLTEAKQEGRLVIVGGDFNTERRP